MALAISKPGQGTWTRIMTACLIAVVTAATAGFVWQQATIIVDKLPKNDWVMGFKVNSGEPIVGTNVNLLADSGKVIGTAKVMAYKPAEQTVRLSSLALEPGATPDAALKIAADGPGAVAGDLVSPRIQQPFVEPIYMQGALAGVVLLLGFIVAYWLVGLRHRTVDFLVATDFEMKKVNWSTPREIMGSTWVVVGACIFVAVLMFTFDFLFKTFFQSIGVLTG